MNNPKSKSITLYFKPDIFEDLTERFLRQLHADRNGNPGADDDWYADQVERAENGRPDPDELALWYAFSGPKAGSASGRVINGIEDDE